MFFSDLKNQKPANGENYIWVKVDSSGTLLATDANTYFIGYFCKDGTSNTSRFRVGSQDGFYNLWRSTGGASHTPTLIPPSTTVKYQGYTDDFYCWGVLYKK